jgi:HEPN domain-containing protein
MSFTAKDIVGMLKSDKDTFQKLDAEAWGHSVYDLLASLQEKFNVEERLLEYALELDKAYIPTRYPNAHPSMSPRRRYTRVEAERLIGYAEVIFNFCKNLLSKI